MPDPDFLLEGNNTKVIYHSVQKLPRIMPMCSLFGTNEIGPLQISIGIRLHHKIEIDIGFPVILQGGVPRFIPCSSIKKEEKEECGIRPSHSVEITQGGS